MQTDMAANTGDQPTSPRLGDFLAEMAALGQQKSGVDSLGLPKVLICGPPHEWDTEYIPTPAATWRQLVGALTEAERKGRDGADITNALRAAAERLRPVMEKDPECTIEDALIREGSG